MNFFRFLLLALALLRVAVGPFSPGRETVPEIIAAPLEAEVGLSPLTGTPSGWYTSDVTLQILAPANVLANGQPLRDGKLTIREEGRHAVEFQPGPSGRDNRVTQFVDIDKTAPRVTWLTKPNSAFAGYGELSAEINDATSGLCSLDYSLDYGRSWETQVLVLPGTRNFQPIQTTTWSLHRDFREFSKGLQLIQLRAHDCAGNSSPDEILFFRVE